MKSAGRSAGKGARKCAGRRSGNPFVKDEGGFTTPAVAVALLLVFALVFMCVDGYRVSSRAGQIQYVADAGALAADTAVAEFVTAGQAVDAALLSLSLLAVSAYAASAVAAFVPGGEGAAAKFAAAGKKIVQVRGRFAKSAVKGLNAAQKALPALCAVRAAQVVRANAEASGQDYVGIAFANPAAGVEAKLADTSAVEAAAEDIEGEEEEVQRKAREQQESQERADEAKERAWRADCGASGMCMRERAGHLAGLSGAENPHYATVDTWSFSVPLARAKAYYRARLASEPGASASGSPEEVGESIARKRFYAYALETVSQGSVSRTASGAENPDLKELARNTAQIRATSLYTQGGYPVSKNGSKLVLHAWTGCPSYAKGEPAGTGSAAQIDAGACERCDECKFSASTLGRVPAASTSISNGFEYHYRIVVEAARDYAEAVRAQQKLNGELDSSREKMARSLKKALESLKGQRYSPQPPGRYGCVCVVFAPGARESPLPFLSSGGKTIARVAISGATLAPDEASDEGSVISGIAQGLVPESGVASGATRTVLGAWETALQAYAGGNDAVVGAFDAVLGKLPLVGTDLSQWAAESFRDAVKDAGLEPADLTTYKPVLVNTSQVTSRGDGVAAKALARLKSAGELYAAGGAGDWGALAEALQDCPDLSGALADGKLVIAELPLSELASGAQGGELGIPAPDDLEAQYAQAAQAVRAFSGGD